MARPRGEIRMALADALSALGSGGAVATVKQLAEASQVGYDAARETLKDMARARIPEAVVVGYDKPAGETRWMAMYAKPEPASWPQPWAGIETLANAMRPQAAEEHA